MHFHFQYELAESSELLAFSGKKPRRATLLCKHRKRKCSRLQPLAEFVTMDLGAAFLDRTAALFLESIQTGDVGRTVDAVIVE